LGEPQAVAGSTAPPSEASEVQQSEASEVQESAATKTRNAPMITTDRSRPWPGDGLTRVPFWVYQDEANYRAELRRIFEGPTWNYVCLESDLPRRGDYRTTFVGEMPVIVTRGAAGAIHAFENRCAHRGALIALDDAGTTGNRFQCIYHAWSYDLEGNLVGVAFEKGSHGRGGMPADFCKAEHGPRKLRTATLHGLVFATLSPDTPPIERYLGDAVRGRVARVLGKPITVLGRFTQALPNNWKLYLENVKDTYHASLLHAFFTTFRITRLTQGGGVIVSPDGAHHASTTIDRTDDRESGVYREQGLRADHEGYRLADPSLLDGVDEFGDGIKLQILTIFPNFVLQQIANCLAVRQIIPKGPRAMELCWTYFGFTDDSPEMLRRRLKQSNLVGPAGYVSMEDGCVGGFVQRGAAAAGNEVSLVQMGGDGAESQETRATEASVRGFWQAYRRHMGY
jgi:phenylpropionate dioxygenase-like ring-hydroxylating dioxygenase large terminal subunit